jgi:hypothetical protein
VKPECNKWHFLNVVDIDLDSMWFCFELHPGAGTFTDYPARKSPSEFTHWCRTVSAECELTKTVEQRFIKGFPCTFLRWFDPLVPWFLPPM